MADFPIPVPDRELQDLLVMLTWDHGTIPFDMERDLETVFVRAVTTVNPEILDIFHTWLGHEHFAHLADRYAEQIPWLGMTLAVYRFDLPKALIDRANTHANDWLGPEDPNEGMKFLQEDWKPT